MPVALPPRHPCRSASRHTFRTDIRHRGAGGIVCVCACVCATARGAGTWEEVRRASVPPASMGIPVSGTGPTSYLSVCFVSRAAAVTPLCPPPLTSSLSQLRPEEAGHTACRRRGILSFRASGCTSARERPDTRGFHLSHIHIPRGMSATLARCATEK